MTSEYRICGGMISEMLDFYLQNPKCTGENKLPPRANLIPAHKEGVFYRTKEKSEMLQSLCGRWKFRYREDGDLEGDFFTCDTDDADWDIIDVPSMWQYRGYGKCSYPNVRYPIPFCPPYICTANPVGYYRRRFTVKKKTTNAILHFGGVDNAFFVWLNGEYVGFSKGSRNPAEFDVSSYLREGENLICVKVFTYSDATYLENQDMLMANGIFRDVYLLHLDDAYLWDYRVRGREDGFYIDAKLGGYTENCRLTANIDGKEAELEGEGDALSCFIPVRSPRTWNAEEPNLYNLTLTLRKDGKPLEIHSKRVGIMHTEVRGKEFLVNGKPIYIKGVNRHEYDPKNGRAIPTTLIEKELREIKSSGLNAIRCSHYTNDPAFYEYASEIGLYVMDEADLETHGMEVTGDRGYITKTPEWFDAYRDRIVRMLENDKNEVCIFMWSLGNEAGEGENLTRCAEIIKEFDPEKAIMQGEDDYVNYSPLLRFGYPSKKKLDDFGEAHPDLPLLNVEFCHAMGNSPGYIEQYWNYIYSHDNTIGGFVWEYKNHGFYKRGKRGRARFLYGGDFGEAYSWVDFCLDGFHTSDGTPKPTWKELSIALFPAHITLDGGRIFVKNTNDFRYLDGISCSISLLCDYTPVRHGEVSLAGIKPHEKKEIKLPFDVPRSERGAKYYLDFAFSERGKEVCRVQKEFKVASDREKYLPRRAELTFERDDRSVYVTGKNFRVGFRGGMVSSYEKDGKELVDVPMKVDFMRAPTDNDGIGTFWPRHIADWNKALLEQFEFRPTRFTVHKENDRISLSFAGLICPPSQFVGYFAKMTYDVFGDGLVLCEMTGKPLGALPDVIPRIGVSLGISKKFDKVRFYGRGEVQSYPDSKLASPVGLYEMNVKDMNFCYDYPQDTGNREDTSFLHLTGEGEGLSFIGADRFSFTYFDFNEDDLRSARHRDEISEADHNTLILNYRVRGLGSRSCGPEPEEEFELHPHTFRFVFALTGEHDTEKLLALSRLDFEKRSEALSGKYVYVPEERAEQFAGCGDPDFDM